MSTTVETRKAKAHPVWYTGVCDLVLKRLQAWYKNYSQGEVSRTRLYMEYSGKITDKPVQFAHRIPWRLDELDHLIRIISAYEGNQALAEEMQKIRAMWKKGRLLPGGYREITLLFFPEHIKKMIDLMEQARLGQTKQSIDEVIQKRKEEGKDLFEV